MSLAQRFERRLEGAVGSAFARVFKGQVEPVEIGNALQREAADKRAVMGNGQVLTPNRYRVSLGTSDYERLLPWEAQLCNSLAELVQESLDDNGWTTIGDVEVYLHRDESLHTGVFGVASRMEPAAPPRQRPYESLSLPSVAGQAPGTYEHPFGSSPPPAQYPQPGGYPQAGPYEQSQSEQSQPAQGQSAQRQSLQGQSAQGQYDQPQYDQPQYDQPQYPPPPAYPQQYPPYPSDPYGAPQYPVAAGQAYAAAAPGYPHQQSQPGSEPPPYVEPPRRPRMRAVLTVDGSPDHLVLRRGSNIVGRGQECDLQLMDQGVSRRHADIQFDGEFAVAYDLGSTNGTTVNGHPVGSQQLQHGDVLRLGHSRVVFQQEYA